MVLICVEQQPTEIQKWAWNYLLEHRSYGTTQRVFCDEQIFKYKTDLFPPIIL